MTGTLSHHIGEHEADFRPDQVDTGPPLPQDTVIPIIEDVSAVRGGAPEESTSTDPLQLTTLLLSATRLAIGVSAAQAALRDILALVTDHGYGSCIGVSRTGPGGALSTLAANTEVVRIADLPTR